MPKSFVRVMGGIGNQIFQYALAQWLHGEFGVATVLFNPGSDSLPGPTSRSVQLGDLFRDCHILNGPAAKAIHLLSLSRKYQHALAAIGFRHYPFFYPEPWQSFRSKLAEATQQRCSVISGYFQFCELVRVQLGRLREGAVDELQKRNRHLAGSRVLRDMDFERDCIIHVRRGDYAKIDGFPLLDESYYASALKIIGHQGFRGRVFHVSDDPPQAGTMLSRAGILAKSLDLHDPLDVLGVIAHCRHKVIANSTLSLWGSLLGRQDGSVVFPQIWLPGNYEVPDLCRSMGWSQCSA